MFSAYIQPAPRSEEKLQKRQLIVSDVLALLLLTVITAALFFVTLALFHSFSSHRTALGRRWRSRGEAALASGRPEDAIDALRAALEYAPGNRQIEMELAQALAAAGPARTAEAVDYFNSLWETEPGSGIINLALARLAVRQGDESTALRDYHAAIYGTWEGDGSVRRREVRLELVGYLLSRRRFASARSELLIALGNAPDDPAIKLRIAGLLEAAGDPVNAAPVYEALTDHPNPPLAALFGAGRAEFAQGRYLVARQFLQEALNRSETDSAADSIPADSIPDETRQQAAELLRTSVHVLALYPSASLPTGERVRRLLHIRSIAAARLAECASGRTDTGLATLLQRWKQAGPAPSARALAGNPDLQSVLFHLALDTETATASLCGAPTGEDALLLRIAGAPYAVEQP